MQILALILALSGAAAAEPKPCAAHLATPVEWQISPSEADQIDQLFFLQKKEALRGQLNQVIARAAQAGKLDSAVIDQLSFELSMAPAFTRLHELVQAAHAAADKGNKWVLPATRQARGVRGLADTFGRFVSEDGEDALAQLARIPSKQNAPPSQLQAIRALWTQAVADSKALPALLEKLEAFERETRRLYGKRCAKLMDYREEILIALELRIPGSAPSTTHGQLAEWQFAANELDDFEDGMRTGSPDPKEILNRVIRRTLNIQEAKQIDYERALRAGRLTLRGLIERLEEVENTSRGLLGNVRAEFALQRAMDRSDYFITTDLAPESLVHMANVHRDFFQPEDKGVLLGGEKDVNAPDFHQAAEEIRMLWIKTEVEAVRLRPLSPPNIAQLLGALKSFETESNRLLEKRTADLEQYRHDILDSLGYFDR